VSPVPFFSAFSLLSEAERIIFCQGFGCGNPCCNNRLNPGLAMLLFPDILFKHFSYFLIELPFFILALISFKMKA